RIHTALMADCGALGMSNASPFKNQVGSPKGYSGSMAARGFQTDQHPFGAAVGRLVDQFASLPGIGRKSAERLANYILSCRESEALALADAIRDVKKSIRRCAVCFNLTEQELCSICRDPRRDRTVVCVVEQPKDVSALEAASAFQG